MIAKALISDVIVPLRTSDTGTDALNIMDEFHLRHLPVVNDKELLGLLSEDDIFNHDVEAAVGSYALVLPRPCVRLSDHLYEVMRQMAEYNLTAIPVVDEEESYAGLIALEDILNTFAKAMPFTEPGAIVVLEMSKQDYMLSQLARIVESEGAVILSSFVSTSRDSNRIDVTLKINRHNVHAILATFERFDYIVKASYSETDYLDSLKERYDSLIHYLNV